MQERHAILCVLVFALLAPIVSAQDDANQEVHSSPIASNRVFGITFEERTRWEERYGVNFGSSPNQRDMLSRLRVGGQFKPVEWLKVYAMGQDSRAPFFGPHAPNTLRDTIDLQEGYVHFFPERTSGFGALFGRQMLNYGETRVIGSPQWSNVARTFDTGRVFYRTAKQRFEILLVSPVKVKPDRFNSPELGERIWGTYDVFSNFWHGASLDAYALRHSQNRTGGWTGPGTLGTNSLGGRLYGPLSNGLAYSLEGVIQGGHLGPVTQHAYAWFTGLSQKARVLRQPLQLSAEYKVASGTKAGATDSATYDQLAAANHDKFGHQDLFAWRNLRAFRSLETLTLPRSVALHLMYANEWLYSASDALYNIQGAVISISQTGSAGTHVGQELDLFMTYRHGPHSLGAGFGHFFKGEFIADTTRNINPRYFYVFQQYSFR